jgi:hypothetical protein
MKRKVSLNLIFPYHCTFDSLYFIPLGHFVCVSDIISGLRYDVFYAYMELVTMFVERLMASDETRL